MAALYNPSRDVYKRFDSVYSYAETLRKLPAKHRELETDSFFGAPYDKAIELLVSGSQKHVAAVERIVEQMQDSNLFASGLPMLAPAVCGFIPNVPAAIAGHPEAMFTRQASDMQSMAAPIAIYVETCISAGVSDTKILNRGVACLGLALALSMFRPVELYAVYSGPPGDRRGAAFGNAVKIEFAAANLGIAAWCFTDPAYPRRLGFSSVLHYANSTNDSISWNWGLEPTKKAYQDALREALGMQADDVIIPGGYVLDTLMLNDPVAWVRKMIEQHSGKQGE